MFERAVRPCTPSYANQVAQGRLFLCLKSALYKSFPLFFSTNVNLIQSILNPLRISNQVCMRSFIKDSALSENLIHPPGTIFIAIALASWTMFNHK
ncbi:hypothetical protein A7589_11540 [Escherichia sp. MOD1-EC6475]|nr:hypothetical protein A7589_11540 [Escherichia sp. MOD1-EC6475]